MSGLIKKEKKGLIMYKFTLLFVVLFITGCSFRPDMPEANIEFTYEKTSEQQIKQDWWKDFGDEKLSELKSFAAQTLQEYDFHLTKNIVGYVSKDVGFEIDYRDVSYWAWLTPSLQFF